GPGAVAVARGTLGIHGDRLLGSGGGGLAPRQQRLDAVDDRHQAVPRSLQGGHSGGGRHRASPASSGRGALARWVGAIGAIRGGAGGSPPAAASIAVQAAKCGARSITSSGGPSAGVSGVQDTRISTSTVEAREASAP